MCAYVFVFYEQEEAQLHLHIRRSWMAINFSLVSTIYTTFSSNSYFLSKVAINSAIIFFVIQ